MQRQRTRMIYVPTEVLDRLAAPFEDYDPATVAHQRMLAEFVRKMVRRLPKGDRICLTLRYGLGDTYPCTLEEMERILRHSRQRLVGEMACAESKFRRRLIRCRGLGYGDL